MTGVSALRRIAAENARAALRERAHAARREANEIFDLLAYIDEIEQENRSLNMRMDIIRAARGDE